MPDPANGPPTAARPEPTEEEPRAIFPAFGDPRGDVTNALRGSSIFPKSYPSHIYHYTNLAGVIGILKTQQIWATDVRYLNDTSEELYATRVIEQVLRQTATDPTRPGLMAAINLSRPTTSRAHAACFCQARDLLSQWRAHSTQGTTSYALEFEWGTEEMWPYKYPNVIAGRVEYDESLQKELIQNLSRSLIGRILDGSDPAAAEFRSWPEQDANKLTQYVPTTLLGPTIAWLGATTVVRCFLKSRVFSEEKEWRIIVHKCDAADQEFRPSNGILLPYVPIDLQQPGMPRLTKKLVGPSPHPEEARDSLERYLHKNGLPRIVVESSQTRLSP